MAETRKKTGKTVVVALGGNAILQPGQVGTFEEQLFNVDGAMRRIAELVESGWRVVLTHGNGPQVGNLLIQNALAAKTVAPQTSMGIGATVLAASAFWMRRLPTWGPLPCVSTTCQPLSTSSAMRRMAPSTLKSCSSKVPTCPGCRMALPPRATTTVLVSQ